MKTHKPYIPLHCKWSHDTYNKTKCNKFAKKKQIAITCCVQSNGPQWARKRKFRAKNDNCWIIALIVKNGLTSLGSSLWRPFGDFIRNFIEYEKNFFFYFTLLVSFIAILCWNKSWRKISLKIYLRLFRHPIRFL